MPYQGTRERIELVSKVLSFVITLCLIFAGFYYQLTLMQKNKYNEQLEERLQEQYSAAMYGKRMPRNPVRNLERTLRRIRDVKDYQIGITEEGSITTKLIFVMEALNQQAAATNLELESVSITTKTISVVGSTSSRRNTLKLFDSIKDKFNISQQQLNPKGGRDNFRITLDIQKDRSRG